MNRWVDGKAVVDMSSTEAAALARAGGEAEGWEGWQRAATVLDPKAQLLAPITHLQQGLY